MEGWGKIGVQRASVLYQNSCYNEPCYIEVQVYNANFISVFTYNFLQTSMDLQNRLMHYIMN